MGRLLLLLGGGYLALVAYRMYNQGKKRGSSLSHLDYLPDGTRIEKGNSVTSSVSSVEKGRYSAGLSEAA